MELAEKIKTLLEEPEVLVKKGHYETFKRIFDFCFALLLLPFLFPLMLFIALLIKLDSKGSVFFSQKRVGKNGRHFDCYKFRTMVENAERLRPQLAHLNEMHGPAFKIKNDPRTTRIGKFFRKYSIDEFPQIFNILKGEMSFVGPRPPLPEEVKEYKPWQMRRLSVKPGLTCYWQINGRNKIYNFNDWVKMDLKYIDEANLLVDLKLVLRTLPAVLSRKGAY
jgi:exopolysaccharide biosynthesis polyprenyl glycosylphosphotransferase